MGTHGTSGYKEFFIGSNAQRVVTLSEIPVLTIQKKIAKSGFKNILIPIDNSLHSREKVNIALIIAGLSRAKIHILGLSDSDYLPESKEINTKLKSVEQVVHTHSLEFLTSVINGKNLSEAALKYASENNCDLIVINTGHESNITGIFLGALAQQIVNHSKIPVLSCKHSEGYSSIETPGFGIS
jgi:nucleotide-binding universal stress UspA family protein